MINAARLCIKWGMGSFQKSGGRLSAATFLAALAVFLLTVGLFVGVFFWYGRDYARVSAEREYYFLVRDCEETTAAAVAGQVYLSGGAGFRLDTAGGSCVVLACYFRVTDAERVQSAMEEKEIATRILTLSGSDFVLEGKNAAQKSRVEGNLETAETCARILYDTANGLERADLSQEEARVAVRGVVKALKGLRGGNEENLFGLWNVRLAAAERRGTEIADGILYAKDLRYLQAELCLAIVNAGDCFS